MANVPMVEVDASNGVTYRISAKVRKALEAIVFDAASIKEAAAIAGMKRKSLDAARAKPHVQKVEEQMLADHKAASRVRAWSKLPKLMEDDDGRVALKAIDSILDRTEGKAVQHVSVESTHTEKRVIFNMNVDLAAGINTQGVVAVPDKPRTIDGQLLDSDVESTD